MLVIVFYICSSSNPWVSWKPTRVGYSCQSTSDLNHILSSWGNSRKRCLIRFVLLDSTNLTCSLRPVGHRKHCFSLRSSRRIGNRFPFASADEGVTVNGSPQASTSSDVEEMKVKLNQSLHSEDHNDGLVQFLHDAARVFELAIKEQGSVSKLSWFSTAWLGVDRNAWVKSLSYQVLLSAF